MASTATAAPSVVPTAVVATVITAAIIATTVVPAAIVASVVTPAIIATAIVAAIILATVVLAAVVLAAIRSRCAQPLLAVLDFFAGLALEARVALRLGFGRLALECIRVRDRTQRENDDTREPDLQCSHGSPLYLLMHVVSAVCSDSHFL
jgi:hypothetical protein